MILTVTLNPALELTYRVPRLDVHGTHRVRDTAQRPGGRGLATALVLSALGHRTTVTGFAGGRTGEALRALLATRDGVREAFVTVGGDTRGIVAVTDEATGGTTRFNELGPHITSTEWAAFRDAFTTLLHDPDTEAVALCGSLPPGVPVGAYAQLVRDSRTAGRTVLLDAGGEPLRRGLAARPDVVTPGIEELSGLTGSTEPLRAARGAQRRGAHAVAASLGADGLLVVAPDGLWHAVPPAWPAGTPAHADGSATAGLLSGTVEGLGWPDRIARAVALSAANTPADGLDREVYEDLLPRVKVTEQNPTA